MAAMDVDDMDIDIDLGVADPSEYELETTLVGQEMAQVAPSTIPDTQPSQNTSTQGLQPTKVHLRGVDNLTTDHIKAFALEHFPPEFERIEWIDDTSANIIYSSDNLAAEALIALTDEAFQATDTLDQTDIRPAKKFSTHPDSILQVRIAITTDVKKPRARDASRFYLMNPEHDPSNRRRQYDGRDRRAGNQRYSDDRPKRRRGSDTLKPFDENMYDDAPAPSAKPQAPFEESMYDDPPAPGSLAARITGRDQYQRDRRDDSRPRMKRARSGDLIDNFGPRRGGGEVLRDGNRSGQTGESGRLRNRSASPLLEGDGRYGFDGEDTRNMRQRSLSPGRDRMNISQQGMRPPSQVPRQSKELFPERMSVPENQLSTPRNQASRELLVRKGSSSHHRRNAAMDSADGTNKDLFADRMNTAPEGRSASRAQNDLFADRLESKKPDLFADRLGTAKQGSDTATKPDLFASRLTGTEPAAANGGAQLEFSIKGAANGAVDQDFKIRGAAGLNNPRIKELFPERGNSATGKDLFSSKMKERKKADLFF